MTSSLNAYIDSMGVDDKQLYAFCKLYKVQLARGIKIFSIFAHIVNSAWLVVHCMVLLKLNVY